MLIMSFLFVVFAPLTSSQNHATSIHRRSPNKVRFFFTHQSQGLSFGDWCALLTACFAPLVAHLVAGVPGIGKPPMPSLKSFWLTDVVYLSYKRIHWTDRIGLYNPTTILWRYFVIFDRRVRCLNWSASTMAASNALFWNGNAWDGSEAMITRSRHFYMLLPTQPYVNMLSVSALTSVIVAIQGAQALYLIIVQFTKYSKLSTSNLATVFFPLAIYGLLRLPAAL
jgi:hypothetical protein